MRTATFADERVVDLLNGKFIAVWNNHNPAQATRGEQPVYSEAEAAAYPEGGGAGNVRSFFATPEGRILFELQGHWRPERYLESIRFALELTPENFRERHRAMAETLAGEMEKIRSERPEEAGKPVRESPVLRTLAASGLLLQWHQYSQTVDVADLLAYLEQVREESQFEKFV